MYKDKVDDDYKGEGLLMIKDRIEDVMNRSKDGDFVDEQIYGINLEDIHRYMDHITYMEESWKFNRPSIKYVDITKQEDFGDICDYVSVTNVDMPRRFTQKIYFVESEDFVSVFIPIQLDDDNVNIHIESLEDSPDFITQKYAELDEEKSIDSFDFVKFDIDK